MVDYDKSAEQIIKFVGGKENISKLIHCSTRLRFTLKNQDKVNLESLKQINGVLGAVNSSGQCQVIIGNNVVEMYDAISKQIGQLSSRTEESNATKEKWYQILLDYLIAIFQPLIPAIAGGGVLKALTMLLGMLGWISQTSSLYQFLNFIGTAPLYFLPILVAITTAQKLNVNVLVAVSVVGTLILPDFVTSLAKGISLFNIKLTNITYSSQVFPAILAVFLYAFLEKKITKYCPKPIRIFFVPLLCMTITVIATAIALGPMGYYFGVVLTSIIMFLYNHFGFIACALLAGILPIMVSMGMHKAFIPYVISALSSSGYEILYNPASLAHNMSECGMSFAVAIKTKDSKLRSTAISAGISALFGITEPALYGINLQHKRALIATMTSSAISGGIIGLLGIKSFVPVGPGLASLPMFADKADPSNLFKAIFMFFFSIVFSFAIGLILWKDPEKTSSTKRETIESPVKGTILPLSEVKDDVFSKEILGKGIAIKPSEGKLIAPANGTITMTYKTGHAVGMKTDNGTELLFHIGINTVKLNGKYFKVKVKEGQKIKKGDILVDFDLDSIKLAGFDPITVMIVTNSNDQNIKLPKIN
ncbi:beta-glucoside-specific PTS transporter subunit IIABC [Lactobacillus kullabergensis]|uniref:beta-glucoside-specific PTS transporter subunit IIABC n=1 Tax=Lactobacillus kullabergensis TaxID=1218493 RepID=UPI0022482248|nr:beta-glucoside-specific PTS transporter subunit IIABC [Lactobacillus kullabergensis]MCX0290225.1 beta-glucoside-specific PTS transporter subunit IIABC [Lactobacillus kullabergensis]